MTKVRFFEPDFCIKLNLGEWCRTGMLGFLRRDQTTDELGLFVIGNMIEHFSHRGYKFHPHFIEETIVRTHR